MFQNPIKMQFATNFLMIEQLLKLRHVEQIVIDLEWMTFFNMLHNTHQHKSLTKARYVQTNIKKDKFFYTCANFVHMVEWF